MKFLVTLIIFSASSFVYAETSNHDVEDSIKKMIKENVISESEARKIKRNSYTNRIASRGPASVSNEGHTIQETKPQDLDVAQFRAIQYEMKRMLQR